MCDPPDRSKSNTPLLKWDKNKTIKTTNNLDPIYLLMTRTNSTENLTKVSPFLIKKVIDNTCGEVMECKKIRSGQILIKTKNLEQAKKMITLTEMGNNITVDITEHQFLNTSKGVIYSNELRGIPENEIVDELKTQNVTEIRKIMKKNENELTETGLIILTFQSTNTPKSINIGYSKVDVRPYIPPAMRCRNCLKYNHTSKYCKSLNVCINCGTHHSVEENEICQRPKNCSNCSAMNISPTNHTAVDKKCPVFIKENELQAIKTNYKVDHKTAKQIYSERHQHNITPYSEVTKQTIEPKNVNPSTTVSKQNSNNHQLLVKSPKLSTCRSVITYDDSSDDQPQKQKTSNLTKRTKILPIKTPKRIQRQLKKPNAKTTHPKESNYNINTSTNKDHNNIMDYSFNE